MSYFNLKDQTTPRALPAHMKKRKNSRDFGGAFLAIVLLAPAASLSAPLLGDDDADEDAA
jgi:hypothetical protein